MDTIKEEKGAEREIAAGDWPCTTLKGKKRENEGGQEKKNSINQSVSQGHASLI